MDKTKLQILGKLKNGYQAKGDNRKSKKGISQENKKLLKTKICCRNLIKGINIWAVSLVRYSGPFLI